jgi:hypothetical protein
VNILVKVHTFSERCGNYWFGRIFFLQFFSCLIFLHGRTPWTVDQPVARPLPVFVILPVNSRIRDSAIGIATGCGLEDQGVGVRVPVGSRIFCSPRRPDRLWGPPNLLSNGYWGLFFPGVKLTAHLQLVPRSSKCGSIRPVPHTPSCRSAWLVKHRDSYTFYQ